MINCPIMFRCHICSHFFSESVKFQRRQNIMKNIVNNTQASVLKDKGQVKGAVIWGHVLIHMEICYSIGMFALCFSERMKSSLSLSLTLPVIHSILPFLIILQLQFICHIFSSKCNKELKWIDIKHGIVNWSSHRTYTFSKRENTVPQQITKYFVVHIHTTQEPN